MNTDTNGCADDSTGDTLYPDAGRWTLRFERRLAHPPGKVWRALTDPDQLSRWYPLRAAELDLRVGGAIRFRDDEDTPVHAEITALTEPSLFAFREYDEASGAHDLRFVLESDGDGCLLRFTHTFADKDWAAHTAAGWNRCLDALGTVVAGGVVVWPDNGAELRRRYARRFGLPSAVAE